MSGQTRALGIDFGTSNTAAGYLCDGVPCLIDMATGQTTLPTTFFFDFDSRKTLIGEPANRALLDGVEGRFMRALKRVLGTSLMHEKRQILNQRVTFVDVIGHFLREVKRRAEVETGLRFDHALSGRPVVFHGTGDPREQQAEDDLRACYLAAGFRDVSFMAEPEAAAIASGALNHPGATGLIVDVGGGTSDFSIFRSGSDGIDILANHGVRIGGTDFDRAISFEQVMPLLGKGGALRNVMGPGRLPAPNALFDDLATWEKIPFLYTAQNRRDVAEMARMAVEPDRFARLAAVLQDELGHELAFAVERGKIDANAGNAQARIGMEVITPGLSAALPPDDLERILAPFATSLQDGLRGTLQRAGIAAEQVDQVIYVGGSSLMSVVSGAIKQALPKAQHSFSEVFTAVTHGLARATGRV